MKIIKSERKICLICGNMHIVDTVELTEVEYGTGLSFTAVYDTCENSDTVVETLEQKLMNHKSKILNRENEKLDKQLELVIEMKEDLEDIIELRKLKTKIQNGFDISTDKSLSKFYESLQDEDGSYNYAKLIIDIDKNIIKSKSNVKRIKDILNS